MGGYPRRTDAVLLNSETVLPDRVRLTVSREVRHATCIHHQRTDGRRACACPGPQTKGTGTHHHIAIHGRPGKGSVTALVRRPEHRRRGGYGTNLPQQCVYRAVCASSCCGLCALTVNTTASETKTWARENIRVRLASPYRPQHHSGCREHHACPCNPSPGTAPRMVTRNTAKILSHSAQPCTLNLVDVARLHDRRSVVQ